MKEVKALLLSLGVREDDIDGLARWDRIKLLRALSSKAANEGTRQDVRRFARSARSSQAAMVQQYRKTLQQCFESQIHLLQQTKPRVYEEEPDDDELDEEAAKAANANASLADELEQELSKLDETGSSSSSSASQKSYITSHITKHEERNQATQLSLKKKLERKKKSERNHDEDEKELQKSLMWAKKLTESKDKEALDSMNLANEQQQQQPQQLLPGMPNPSPQQMKTESPGRTNMVGDSKKKD